MNIIEWRVSPAFPKYEVSNTGCVRRLNTRSGAVRKLAIRSDGYMDIDLWANGEKTNCLVHRLVANAFLGIDFYDKSIVIADERIAIKGFEEALPGAHPIKQEDGTLAWIIPDTSVEKVE
mgnify:CR=1 FL=1